MFFKKKKQQNETILILRKIEPFGSKIKNTIIFSQKNVFLIFQQKKLFSPKLKKLMKFHERTFRTRKKTRLCKKILHLKK